MTKEKIEPATIQILRQWDLMSDYTELTTPELERMIRLHKHTKEMSLDTETTSLDTITAQCLGYSFSFEPHVAYWVPIHYDPQLKLLNELVKGKEIVVFFNAGYDLAIVEKYGVEIPEKAVRDVMIACFLRDVDGYKRNAGLKTQAEVILSLPTVEFKDILRANLGHKNLTEEEIDFNTLEPWQKRVYGSQDADITIQLWRDKSIQDAITQGRTMEIWELEHKVIRPLMEMYKNGVGIDLDKVAELDSVLLQECKKCNEQAHQMALAGCDVTEVDGKLVFVHEKLAHLTKKKGLNLGSFPQKQILLFEELGLPHTRKTTTGWSTDQEALEVIENEHPIIPIIMRYTKLVSRRNSYTKKLPRMVNEVTGRIHTTLWGTGVKSGRLSSSNPNMQGISKDCADDDPAKIREVFVPSKGNMLTAADYSQMELRVAASLSREPKLCEPYKRGNIDVHQKTASEIYEILMDEVTTDQRNIAKTANFSILTGITAYTLSARNKKTIPTVEMAQEIIDKWFAGLPVMKVWVDQIHRIIRTTGKIDTYFGRTRPFPDVHTPSEFMISERIQNMRTREWAQDKDDRELAQIAKRSIIKGCERQGLSHIIQGTAADIMKISMVRVYNALKKAKLPNTKMILQVHDELLFDHPPEVKEELDALITKAMTFEKIGEGWVPMTVDIGQGDNWSAAH